MLLVDTNEEKASQLACTFKASIYSNYTNLIWSGCVAIMYLDSFELYDIGTITQENVIHGGCSKTVQNSAKRNAENCFIVRLSQSL